MTLRERLERWISERFRGRRSMITCREQVDLLVDYLDGTLDPEIASALERHLDDCASCLNFMNTYKTTIKWVGEEICEDMPQALKARLSSFLKAKIREDKAGGPR